MFQNYVPIVNGVSKPTKFILRNVYKILISLAAASLFWPILILWTVIILIVRIVVQFLLNLTYGPGKYNLATGIDSVFAYDKNPNGTAIIHSILVHKGEADLVKIRERYEKRVFTFVESPNQDLSNEDRAFTPRFDSNKNNFDTNFDSENAKEALYAKRLKKTFCPKFGFACWADNSKEFDLSRHVRLLEGVQHSDIITEDKLLSMISRLMDEGTMFNNEHPQWEHLIVPRYEITPEEGFDNPGVDQGPHFVSIVRVHHAYADGASFSLLLDSVLSEKGLKYAINPLKPFPGSTWWKNGIVHAQAIIFGPWRFLLTIKSAVTDRSKFIIGSYSPRKIVQWSRRIDMNMLKELREVSGSSMSAILLTALTGAMRRVCEVRPREFSTPTGTPPETINVGNMSIMLPYKSRQFQNHFTTFSLPLPLKEKEGLARLRGTDEVCREVSYSAEPTFNYFIMRWTGLLPRFLQDFLAETAGTPVLFSNVPGALEPFEVFGGEVVDAGAWLPMVKTYGLGVATYSYCDKMRLCITTDSSLFENQQDVKWLIDQVESELSNLANDFGVDWSNFNQNQKPLPSSPSTPSGGMLSPERATLTRNLLSDDDGLVSQRKTFSLRTPAYHTA